MTFLGKNTPRKGECLPQRAVAHAAGGGQRREGGGEGGNQDADAHLEERFRAVLRGSRDFLCQSELIIV